MPQLVVLLLSRLLQGPCQHCCDATAGADAAVKSAQLMLQLAMLQLNRVL